MRGARHAKVRTLLDTVPDVLGPNGSGELNLGWTAPDGHAHHASAAILVSNNRYRLGRAVGSGTRPRIDRGVLGVAVVGDSEGGWRPWREWSTPAFEVDASGPVPAGIDGEAMKLEPPLRFRTRPKALHVRIAPAHPGVSPSAMAPEGVWEGIRVLGRIAMGREPH